jgi:hypothetical protein
MADLRAAAEKLDNREFKGNAVRCVADVILLSPFPLQASSHSAFLQYHRLEGLSGELIPEEKGTALLSMG